MPKLVRRPRGFYTVEQCHKLALRFTTRAAFRAKENSAYVIACREGWIDEICKHMKGRAIRGSLTKEKCRCEAARFTTRTKFQKKSPSAYSKAWKEGWLDEICKHMISPMAHEHGYWSRENVEKQAKKFKTRKEFRETSSGAYAAAYRGGYLDQICEHMIETRHPMGYWNSKKRVLENARLYDDISTWRKKSRGASNAADKNGWIELATAHMIIKQRKPYTKKELIALMHEAESLREFRSNAGAYDAVLKRFRYLLQSSHTKHWTKSDNADEPREVYRINFHNNGVYFGISLDSNIRLRQHLTTKGTTVFDNRNDFISMKIVARGLTEKEAITKEKRLIYRYRANPKYRVLNQSDGGEPGGCVRRYSEDDIRAAAKRFNTRKDWERGDPSTYASARLYFRDSIEKMTTHMKRRNKWSKTEVKRQVEAGVRSRKFRTRTDISRKEKNLYAALICYDLLKTTWFDEILPSTRQSWRSESSIKKAVFAGVKGGEFRTRKDIERKNKGLYHAISKYGLLHSSWLAKLLPPHADAKNRQR